jgi:SIR2-like protein
MSIEPVDTAVGDEVSLELEEHYHAVVRALKHGNLVPVLGAGANLCGRPTDASFETGRYLPSGNELAERLAQDFNYPSGDPLELVRVSQYASLVSGSQALYDTLHEIFDADYPPTPLHTFLAGIPQRLREADALKKYPLVMTTNYDDSLERAFRDAGEEFDLVSYVAEGKGHGRFRHWAPGEPPCLIDEPESYLKVSPDRRSVILKIHGLVDRRTNPRPEDSYVITEDHYIEYLSWTDLTTFLPVKLLEHLTYSAFLFLGYSMRDWNLRAILNRLWNERDGGTYNSWAVQVDPDRIERKSWEKRDVQIFDIPLDHYVQKLDAQLSQSLASGV